MRQLCSLSSNIRSPQRVLCIVRFETAIFTFWRLSSFVWESRNLFRLRFATSHLSCIRHRWITQPNASYSCILSSILCKQSAFGGIFTFQTTSFAVFRNLFPHPIYCVRLGHEYVMLCEKVFQWLVSVYSEVHSRSACSATPRHR